MIGQRIIDSKDKIQLIASDTIFGALRFLFEYGKAKGYRAAKAGGYEYPHHPPCHLGGLHCLPGAVDPPEADGCRTGSSQSMISNIVTRCGTTPRLLLTARSLFWSL